MVRELSCVSPLPWEVNYGAGLPQIMMITLNSAACCFPGPLVQKTRIQAASYIFYCYSRFTYLTHEKFDHKEKRFLLIDINFTTFAKKFLILAQLYRDTIFLIYHDIKIIQAFDVWRLIESAGIITQNETPLRSNRVQGGEVTSTSPYQSGTPSAAQM